MKMIIGLFLLLLIALAGVVLFQGYIKNGFFSFLKSTTVTVNNQKFNVSVARTDKEKQIGLSEKKSLGQSEGMLFIFDKPDFYSFWMKNMQFPIDIIYINGSKVVTVLPNQQKPVSENDTPPILKPDQPADKVLEINAGLSDKYNIKPGDNVTIENL